MSIRNQWRTDRLYSDFLKTEISEIEIPVCGKLQVALIYPNSYSVGMSNLGFLTAHRLIGSVPQIGVERFFFPFNAEKPHLPPFYSFETRRPLGDFDVLAFSISFEGDFEKLPAILNPINIPIRREKRKGRKFPILIAGGAAVSANPNGLAHIFDILVLGEGETIVPQLFDRLIQTRDLKACCGIPGCRVPEFEQLANPVTRFHDVANFPAYAHIIAPKSVFGAAQLVEVMRGCTRRCNFCFARKHYFPPRPVSAAIISNWLEARPNLSEIGLVAPSLFDHPEIEKILELIAKRQMRLKNSSVKWETLTPKILELLRQCGVQSLTLAPETGSTRLAQAMEKPLLPEAFYSTIEQIFAIGFSRIKLYFMVGLPEETMEDLEQTVKLINKVYQIAKSRAGQLSVAISGFVPKRLTPWADKPCVNEKMLRVKMNFMRSSLNKEKYAGKIFFESPAHIVKQYFFASASENLVEYLENAGKKWQKQGLVCQTVALDMDF